MESYLIQYYFQMPGNLYEKFNLKLSPINLELMDNIPEHLPAWAKLNFHKCSNCPLETTTHHFCPLAANIVNVVKRFDSLSSYDNITVDVITEDRQITQQTTAQRGISSMMGLIIATCGCPHTAFFKPMARFHLPLANEKETLFRATSMYLLAQYYLNKEHKIADFKFEGLRRIYDNIQIVNFAVAERLRKATLTDSSINAVILLDTYAQAVPISIDNSLEEIRHLFTPFLIENVDKVF